MWLLCRRLLRSYVYQAILGSGGKINRGKRLLMYVLHLNILYLGLLIVMRGVQIVCANNLAWGRR